MKPLTLSQIVLNSMHRYQPRIHIMVAQGQHKPVSINDGPVKTFVFEETQFTAVTAYQNQQVCGVRRDLIRLRFKIKCQFSTLLTIKVHNCKERLIK